jgi:pimeloyl-ACP methyl ester carboxylesterase
MSFDRRRRFAGAGALVATLLLVGVAPAAAAPGPGSGPPLPGPRLRLDGGVACQGPLHVHCGYVEVPVDRQDSSLGTMQVFFELYPHSDRSAPADGTIVAVEGGPGYSTTGSRSWYLDLFAPLMDRRDLLLMDLRGTGRSEPIDCPGLQSYRGNYLLEAQRCGQSLGDRADLYGSHSAADDLADVLDAMGIDQVDLYGDSYGTFFSQTFAVRHPDRLRSVVLDSAYWVQWPDPWYSDTNRAIINAFRFACERWATCAVRGDPMERVTQFLDDVRAQPIQGTAPDADGIPRQVTVDPGTVGQLLANAATVPDIYRELDAAIRAAQAATPDNAPILRLLAENTWWYGAGALREFSEGLYVATSCNDYPQAYDMTQPTDVRRHQYKAAIQDLQKNDPDIFWPLTVQEWVTYPDHYWDSCIGWPSPSRLDPPVPPDAVYPDVPVLVLSSDLDSLTSPEGARATADAFPNSTFVSVANMTHVSALGDFGRCASRIVIRFVDTLSAGDTSCANRYAPNRLVDRFAVKATNLHIPSLPRRTAVAAADTVADVVARWWDMFGSEGVGLRGGTFSTEGYDHVSFRLHNVRWVTDVRVSGSITWDRTTGVISASVDVGGHGAVEGRLKMHWNDWGREPTAIVTGTLDGNPVSYAFTAP